MPRKTRKQLVGKLEDVERQKRELEYAVLQCELPEQRQQRTPEDDAPDATLSGETLNTGDNE